MKILFLEIDTEKAWGLASVGPGYIGSYLRTRGHQAALLRILPDQKVPDILNSIAREAPDILGFSLTTSQWQKAAIIAREIRKHMDIPVIAGGMHATFAPLTVLESEGFDYVCLGEGEEAVCELLACIETGPEVKAGQIANIWVKGAQRPKIRPPFDPIEKLPFLARDLLDEKYGVIHMVTQRGCPFDCTFCTAGAMEDLYKKAKYIRRQTVDNVVKELCQIRQATFLNYVIFLDDTFTVNTNWVQAFCRVYGRKIGTGFSINARVETVTRDMVGWLADAGCRHIVFGVESGSSRVRREILNRPMENRRFIEAFNWAKQANIMVTANYMIGLPGETAEDIDQTLDLNRQLEPDDLGYFVFYPYPGTRLFQICRQKGFLSENWATLPCNNRQSILNLPDLTKADIEHYYNLFADARKKAHLNRYGRTLKEDC